jgi:hypothetical protein
MNNKRKKQTKVEITNSRKKMLTIGNKHKNKRKTQTMKCECKI